jgi:hypothetical protein
VKGKILSPALSEGKGARMDKCGGIFVIISLIAKIYNQQFTSYNLQHTT